MIRSGNYRVWHPFPVSCVTNCFNKAFSSQRRGHLGKCVCALSDFICRRRMATSHTNCHNGVCVCAELANFMFSVKSIQERPRGKVTWLEISQIKRITSGLWPVFIYLFFLNTLSSH